MSSFSFEMAYSEDDYGATPFILPQSAIISGATKGGKTTFLKKLLLQPEEMFSQEIHHIYFVYSIWQDSYTELEAFWKSKITFLNTIPSLSFLMNETEDKLCRLLVIDDKLSALNNKDIVDFVCVLCNHRNLSTFLLVQNLFYDSKILRTVSLNVQTLVLFKNRRSERQIGVLASQLCSGNNSFVLDAYRKAVNLSNYNYLVIDLNPRSPPELQYRTCIFPDEVTIVYAPEQST